MSRRLELHELLCSILGSRNVYFQPPASVKMSYPAIIYSRYERRVEHGDNIPYLSKTGYTVTLVDKNPDSNTIEALAMIPYARFDRHYTSENLNHDVFTIYY